LHLTLPADATRGDKDQSEPHRLKDVIDSVVIEISGMDPKPGLLRSRGNQHDADAGKSMLEG
jgi:hypothetical protein